MLEDARRVIIGVGRVKSVSEPIEYHYAGGQKPKDNISGYLSSQGDEKLDPWPALADVLKKPDSLPSYLRDGIGDTLRKKWEKHRKTKIKTWAPYEVEVELASQPGFAYKYRPWEFDSQESTPPLELAYALTVHKTQGSEFGKTFVVIPNPCRNLTREMLYTALTRQKDKIIILHQGDFRDLLHFILGRA